MASSATTHPLAVLRFRARLRLAPKAPLTPVSPVNAALGEAHGTIRDTLQLVLDVDPAFDMQGV